MLLGMCLVVSDFGLWFSASVLGLDGLEAGPREAWLGLGWCLGWALGSSGHRKAWAGPLSSTVLNKPDSSVRTADVCACVLVYVSRCE